jgi:arylsulfatase A-like enzyme
MNSTITTNRVKRPARTWLALFNLTLFSAYFYAFMEWLFFVTKPSSLSILTVQDAGIVLAVTGGVVALLLIDSLVVLSLPAWLVRNSTWKPRLLILSYIVPALMLSITALIMLDNFTYTIFKFGIVSTGGLWRAFYALGFIVFFWQALRFVSRTVEKRPKKPASFLALSLLTISIAAILTTGLSHDFNLGNFNARYRKASISRPNIIILGSDGLSATYMSIYGYEQETTPFLSQMASVSLVAENAFPNASSTTASSTSVLTGKEPATVKVYRYPDVLTGRDSFEHLPGILRQYGYIAVEIGTPYYIDAKKLNLLDGFDVVNNQSLNLPALGLLRTVLGNSPSTYFIWTIIERASERLLHIFFIEDMRNPLAEVTDPKARMTDEEKVNQVIDLLDQADRPVFIFAHLMDTHGPTFSSSKQVPPSESDSGAAWDEDLYKDSIRSFDAHVEKIYEHLAQTGQLDNTILVIYTDHGFKYAVTHRIPIIIHFPKNEHAGSLKNNVQSIDIPVTLMDYLGIPSPAWMTGRSMLDGEPPPARHITSIVAGSPKKIAPPFYQIKIVQVIVCHKWYALNVQENTWNSGGIYKHTDKCNETLLPRNSEVRQEILDYLEKYGYDISSLR